MMKQNLSKQMEMFSHQRLQKLSWNYLKAMRLSKRKRRRSLGRNIKDLMEKCIDQSHKFIELWKVFLSLRDLLLLDPPLPAKLTLRNYKHVLMMLSRTGTQMTKEI